MFGVDRLQLNISTIIKVHNKLMLNLNISNQLRHLMHKHLSDSRIRTGNDEFYLNARRFFNCHTLLTRRFRKVHSSNRRQQNRISRVQFAGCMVHVLLA